MLEITLEKTFLLGFLFHFIKWPSATIERQIDKVNIDELSKSWTHEALVASFNMKQYNKDLSNVPEFTFKSFYKAEIQPQLKDVLKIGFWNRNKCYSFLNNLFYAGARLSLKAIT
ncbi:hypothetical protein ACFLV5_01325 [Chloroflexota bacterium]